MIVCDHVSKYYGAHAAVDDLQVRIARGEVVGLLGLNGAGKTTLLRILSGLVVPTCGRVEIDGCNMADHPVAVRAQVGFAPERPPLYADMTVEAYLHFVARLKGRRGNLDATLHRALEATDLLAVRQTVIGSLSSGYLRRVGIAQAVVHRPTLVLLDEPTSGLDPVQVVHMRRLIRGLRGANTIVVSSHQLSEIHALCDRILVLQQGRIVAAGSEAQLAEQVGGAARLGLEVVGTAAQLRQALQAVAGVGDLQISREADGLVAASLSLGGLQPEQLVPALLYPAFAALTVLLVQSFDRSILTVLLTLEVFAVFGASLLLRRKDLRYAALGGAVGCIIRLLFFDLSQSNTITRAIVFIFVGLLFLGMSALFARYKDRFQPAAEPTEPSQADSDT